MSPALRAACVLVLLAIVGAARVVVQPAQTSVAAAAGARRDLTWFLFSKAPANSPEAIAEEEHQKARDKLVTARRPRSRAAAQTRRPCTLPAAAARGARG